MGIGESVDMVVQDELENAGREGWGRSLDTGSRDLYIPAGPPMIQPTGLYVTRRACQRKRAWTPACAS